MTSSSIFVSPKKEPAISLDLEARNRAKFLFGPFFATSIHPLLNGLKQEGFELTELRLRGRCTPFIAGDEPLNPRIPLNDLDVHADIALNEEQVTRVQQIMEHWLQPFEEGECNIDRGYLHFKIPLFSSYQSTFPKTYIDFTLFLLLDGNEDTRMPDAVASDDGFVIYVNMNKQRQLFLFLTQSEHITADGCPLHESRSLLRPTNDSPFGRFKVTPGYASKRAGGLFRYIRKIVIGRRYEGDLSQLLNACSISCFTKYQNSEQHFGEAVISYLNERLTLPDLNLTQSYRYDFLDKLIHALHESGISNPGPFDPIIAKGIAYHLLLSLQTSLQKHHSKIVLPRLTEALSELRDTISVPAELEEKATPKSALVRFMANPQSLSGETHVEKLESLISLLAKSKNKKLSELEGQLLAENVAEMLSAPETNSKWKVQIATAYLELCPHDPISSEILASHILSVFSDRQGQKATQEILKFYKKIPIKSSLVEKIWQSLNPATLSDERLLLLLKWLAYDSISISLELAQKVGPLAHRLVQDRALLKQLRIKLTLEASKEWAKYTPTPAPLPSEAPPSAAAPEPLISEPAPAHPEAKQPPQPEISLKAPKQWNTTLSAHITNKKWVDSLLYLKKIETSETFLSLPENEKTKASKKFNSFKKEIRIGVEEEITRHFSRFNVSEFVFSSSIIKLYQDYVRLNGLPIDSKFHALLMTSSLALQDLPSGLWHALKYLEARSKHAKGKVRKIKDTGFAFNVFDMNTFPILHAKCKVLEMAHLSSTKRVSIAHLCSISTYPEPLIELMLEITRHKVEDMSYKNSSFPFATYLDQLRPYVEPIESILTKLQVSSDHPEYNNHLQLVIKTIQDHMDAKLLTKAQHLTESYRSHTEDPIIEEFLLKIEDLLREEQDNTFTIIQGNDSIGFNEIRVKTNSPEETFDITMKYLSYKPNNYSPSPFRAFVKSGLKLQRTQQVLDIVAVNKNIPSFEHLDSQVLQDLANCYQNEYDKTQQVEHLARAFVCWAFTFIKPFEGQALDSTRFEFNCCYRQFKDLEQIPSKFAQSLDRLIDAAFFSIYEPEPSVNQTIPPALLELTEYLASGANPIAATLPCKVAKPNNSIQTLEGILKDALKNNDWLAAQVSIDYIQGRQENDPSLQPLDLTEHGQAARQLFANWISAERIKLIRGQLNESQRKEHMILIIEKYTRYLELNGAPPSPQTPSDQIEEYVIHYCQKMGHLYAHKLYDLHMQIGKWYQSQNKYLQAGREYDYAIKIRVSDEAILGLISTCQVEDEADAVFRTNYVIDSYCQALDKAEDTRNFFGETVHIAFAEIFQNLYTNTQQWRYAALHLIATGFAFTAQQLKINENKSKEKPASQRTLLKSMQRLNQIIEPLKGTQRFKPVFDRLESCKSLLFKINNHHDAWELNLALVNFQYAIRIVFPDTNPLLRSSDSADHLSLAELKLN